MVDQNEEIGTVISDEDGPSPSNVSFVVNSGIVHRGQYVEIDYSEGKMVCLVTDVFKTNRYFERAESVKEFEVTGKKLFEQFPTAEWEYLLAQTRPLGVYTNSGAIKRPTYPPSPGAKVKIADGTSLGKFLGFEKGGLNIGEVDYHSLPVELNMSRLLKKHLAVLAMSGAGKCLSPSSKILLGDGRKIEIGTLVDKAISKKSRVEGGVEISEINEEMLNAVSIDEQLNLVKSPIIAFMRRKAPDELLLINTRSGRQLELTNEHFVPILDEVVKWVPAKSLKESDFILVPKPQFDGVGHVIDFLEIWKDSDNVFVFEKEAMQALKSSLKEKKTKAADLAEMLGVSKEKTFVWLRRSIPLKYLIKSCELLGIDFSVVRQKIKFIRGKNTKPMPSLVKVDENFAKLMAYWLAEGYNNPRHITFTNYNKKIQTEFIFLVKEVFNEKAKISKRETEVLVHNSLLSKTLFKLGFTGSSWTKFVPEQILLSPKPVIYSFLSAFIDCDGYIPKNKPEIDICLASKELIDSISTMFLHLGVMTTIKSKTVKGKVYPRVFVRGSENLRALSAGLKFLIEYKTIPFEKHCRLKSNPNLDVAPKIENHFWKLFELLKMPQPQKASASINNYLHRKDNPAKKSLFNLIQIFEKRLCEIEKTIKEINFFANNLPQITEFEARDILIGAYNNGANFNLISNGSGVSSTTARRIVNGITAPTNSAFSLAINVLQKDSRELNDFKNLAGLDFETTARQIRLLCERLGHSTEQLCQNSGLHSQALYEYCFSSKTPSYSKLLSLVKTLQKQAISINSGLPEARQRVGFLKNLAQSELFFDRITKIERIKPEFEFVYDLSVKEHNFIANDILVHNSVAVKTIIEEILSRKKEQGRIAVLVMDVHGEYTSFGEPTTGGKAEDFSSRTKIVKAQNIRIGVPKLSVGLIASIIPGISDPQRRDLEKVLKAAREEMKGGDGPFDLAKVKTIAANSSEIKTKDGLLSWISTLDSLNLFSKTDVPSINDLVKPGQLTVIDLSDLIELKKKQIIVSYFAQRLFRDRQNKKVPPFLFVLEEAHQFIPEKKKEEASISKSIIETISREGRKFGASLCLISQRPVNLSTTALSQCNTHLILRVTNPYDLDHIKESSEGLDSKSTDMITSLRVGEALLVGEAVNHPVFFRVRKNRSPDSRHEISLEQAAFEFEKNSDEGIKEAKEFLE